jgi:hypothetical protein
MVTERNTIVAAVMGVANAGGQLTDSGIDPAIMTTNRAFAHSATEDDYATRATSGTLLREGTASVLRQFEAGQVDNDDVMKSDNNCIHWEDGDLELSDDNMTLPLNKTIVTYKGHASFTPTRRYGLLVGSGRFNYDSVNGQLEFHFRATSAEKVDFDDWEGGESGSPTSLYVGPTDGKSTTPVPPLDERLTPFIRDFAAMLTVGTYSLTPIDYTYLYQDPDALCPYGGKTWKDVVRLLDNGHVSPNTDEDAESKTEAELLEQAPYTVRP